MSRSQRRGAEVRIILLAVWLMVATLLTACSGPESGQDARTTPMATRTATSVSGVPTSTSAATETATATIPAVVETPGEPTATVQAGTPTEPPNPTATATPITPTQELTPTPQPPIDLGQVQISVEQVGSGFSQPVTLTHAGDGSGRRFVVEKTGMIRLLDGSVYLDLTDRVLAYDVRTTQHELGLVGLAFHPDFETNHYFYVHYTNQDQDHVISRFSEGADGLGDPASEKVLITYDQPDVNFFGGTLAFGPDGYLYIGMGTGTSVDADQIVAQQLDNLYGKILRIDVNSGDPYGIPPDNPFVNTPGARPEVWAYGLRNPWRFSFDPANGDVYIGSPGEFAREWINYIPAGSAPGKNFGWPILEGGECWEYWTGDCTTEGFELPIYVRPTYQDGNCVILGGFVYRGQLSPSLNGVYLFSDYCSGRIWGLARDAAGVWQSAELYNLAALVSSFGEDEAGEIYIFEIENGIVYRIVGTR
ncbi:MAG TPA: PQQ-dependent sugar dehydrogenase [Thermomicrobiales bacterium]|nr:PQQ-dependent sugar dehydrogenase [Thermomicrobiales bacterium]